MMGPGMLRAWFRNWNISTVSAVRTGASNILTASLSAARHEYRTRSEHWTLRKRETKPFLSLSLAGEQGGSLLEDNGVVTCKYPNIPKSKWREDFTSSLARVESRSSWSQQTVHTDHGYVFSDLCSPPDARWKGA